MSDGQIKVQYISLDYYAVQILSKGTSLGSGIQPSEKDNKSTITANGAAHICMTDESNLRSSLTMMSIKENSNVRVMGTAFKSSEEDLNAFYNQTFSYEIG